jgi:hypothetical protein
LEGAVNPLGLHDRLVWDILARQVRRGRLSDVCFGPIESSRGGLPRPNAGGLILPVIAGGKTARW